ncbi:MAG: UDP-N-acetylmuramoyl-L-alanyl-D-glutamate--2,6-diaminopimelate ligase [Chloroflexi bacterium AL-W]|nr:UDP-N-acetylmuramoyl-L-alanyl-D-glutamate--2,6-diaminopimelate ligase [Chloroflexi bacterium AL-N1]NOK64950.1 UDP-N-acetylmuramoyl-L-alanyl-D-glutamate--2,6-diaminopimelate ligase [Chloroflexi bacterium AL-N10]NOK76720.1 UDP-N-acetylmuramoyl-L-alanyl-D-glutamate--2,6-diaminopimelate ligase [Chloroflexi bacterium AL-N5]NOK84611.1 UDP-N-acetylmuramoyl-L-alanyl-D-glutamate--2,6-diaminopimelate ligase [Chloroflexi bacterium AL-W]NOK86564.1 UDP-N-acetylmuramoyl-L-alanyl-D-glutamate--2,6-diaminopi
MHLTDLVRVIPDAHVDHINTVQIHAITYDSRKVQPGSLFVAMKGFHVDGHIFIRQALERGAVAVLYEDTAYRHHLDTISSIYVPNARTALAPLAAAFYGYPGQSMRVVGITGTDGKTTTTFLTSVALEAGGYITGLMGTVDFKIAGRQWANDTRQSTPEAVEVQALLRDMANAHCEYAVLEATSHALSASWNRLGGSGFDIAMLTNVTQEHLDFHGTVEQYRRDKARLFEMLGEIAPGFSDDQHKQRKIAIVNADDPNHRMFLDAAPDSAERLTYAVHNPADLRAFEVHSTRDGLRFRVATPWGEAPVRLQLTGDFNVANVLAALSVALVEGVPLESAIAALERVPGVRGRMERINCGQPFTVLVDYAHTPGSFEKLLKIVRPLTKQKLIVVFGSAGERDRDKRPLQGAIAARFCDFLVLTDEDPRLEDRHAIIDEIAAGIEQEGKREGMGYVCIPDRATAIRRAFAQAQPGDIVLLLGKGHEGSIIYGQENTPWNEVGEAYAALTELGYNGEPRKHSK